MYLFIQANRNHYDKDRELSVLKKGLTTSNDDVDLWTKLFEYYINRDYLRNAMAVLFESANIIKVNSLPLWEIMELYVLSTEEEMVCFILTYKKCCHYVFLIFLNRK